MCTLTKMDHTAFGSILHCAVYDPILGSTASISSKVSSSGFKDQSEVIRGIY